MDAKEMTDTPVAKGATPRCDAAVLSFPSEMTPSGQLELVAADFARQLERSLSAALAERDDMARSRDDYIAMNEKNVKAALQATDRATQAESRAASIQAETIELKKRLEKYEPTR